MDLSFSEDQKMFRDSAIKFLANEYPVESLRREWEDKKGFSRTVWDKMSELGWPALRLPEQ